MGKNKIKLFLSTGPRAGRAGTALWGSVQKPPRASGAGPWPAAATEAAAPAMHHGASASHLVDQRWWGPRAFSRENSGIDHWTCETEVSLPTSPAALLSTIPSPAQLQQVGDWGGKWLPARWHHTRALLYLTPPVNFPLSVTHHSKNRTAVCQLCCIQQASPSQSSLLA